jgi:hypothetical protein
LRKRRNGSGLNIDTLQDLTSRKFTETVSGLVHPNFVRIVNEWTTEGPENIKAAAKALSA